MNRKRLTVLTVCLSMILTSMSFGQDLIEATQLGLNSAKETPANRIAKRIESHNATNSFMPTSLFKVAKEKQLSAIQHTNYIEGNVYLKLDLEALLQVNLLYHSDRRIRRNTENDTSEALIRLQYLTA